MTRRAGRVSEAEMRGLIGRVRVGDRAAYDAMIDALAPLATAIARGLARNDRRGADWHLIEDLRQSALTGIFGAAESFDLARGDALKHCAQWMRQAAVTELVKNRLIAIPYHEHPISGRKRSKRAEAADRAMRLCPVGGPPVAGEPDPLDGLLARPGAAGPPDEWPAVVAAIAKLPAIERHVLIRRAGLDGGEPATRVEIGRELGESRQYVEFLERRAIARLRQRLGDTNQERASFPSEP
jgi:DNA-directed RNA polymerase sigma subunit (sigma70/sigma32)